MSNKDPKENIVEAIIEDRSVDWNDFQDTPEDDTILANLKKIEAVARAHKETEGDELPFRTWGDLQLKRYLGSGTFGDVYLAWEPAVERNVVLKLFKPHLSEDPTRRRWLLDEARRLARISHPNVVKVYGAKVDRDRMGFWMDYLEGTTLEEHVESKGGRLDAREAASICRDLAGALTAVHKGGMVHCDIKGSNVFRQEDGHILLMDFGSSALVDEGRKGKSIPRGTPLYMAPEVLLSGEVDTRSDIYSLGVLLHRLVTGEVPVKGMSVGQIEEAHKNLKSGVSETDFRRVPGELRPALERCLAPNPDKRFSTAEECKESLKRAASGGGTRGTVFALGGSALILALAGWFTLQPEQSGEKHYLETTYPLTISGKAAGHAWSPTADEIAYGNGEYVMVSDPAGSSERKVRSSKFSDVGWLGAAVGDWWPDGKSLMMNVWDGSTRSDVYQVPMDGSPVKKVLEHAAFATLSSGGDSVFYFPTDDLSFPETRTTFVCDLKTGEKNRFLPRNQGAEGAFDGHYFVMPNPRGKELAYVRLSDRIEYRLMSFDGSNDREWPITAFMPNKTSPWVPDGSAMLMPGVDTQGYGIWHVPLGSEAPTRIAYVDAPVNFVKLSKSGDWLSYTKGTHHNKTMFVDIETGSLQPSPSLPVPMANPVFAVRDSSVYFQSLVGNRWQVWNWNSRTGSHRRELGDPHASYAMPLALENGDVIIGINREHFDTSHMPHDLYVLSEGELKALPEADKASRLAPSARNNRLLFSVRDPLGGETVYLHDLNHAEQVFKDYPEHYFLSYDWGLTDHSILLLTRSDTEGLRVLQKNLRNGKLAEIPVALPSSGDWDRGLVAVSHDQGKLAVAAPTVSGLIVEVFDTQAFSSVFSKEYEADGDVRWLAWSSFDDELMIGIHDVHVNLYTAKVGEDLKALMARGGS